LFVLNQVGTQGNTNNYVTSAQRSLEANLDVPFKFCGWHKNQRLYQTGDKTDETGYAILDTCRRYGAVVGTAHEHSYSRTVLMDDFASQSWVEPIQSDTLQLDLGRSFLFVSSLGGRDIRAWRNNAQNNPWWAANAASDNNVDYGALLCTFEDDSAECKQTDISGDVWDTFTILPPSNLDGPVPKPRCTAPFLEFGAAEDVHEDVRGLVEARATSFSLTQSEQKIAFRFENVEISALDNIQAAHLQLFGFSAESGNAMITIRAEITPDSPNFGQYAPMKSISDRARTLTSITWTRTDGELQWEEGEVWVSPNIQRILEEVVALPQWKSGYAITLIVEGSGAARHVYTRDAGDCMAPTLTIELETKCLF